MDLSIKWMQQYTDVNVPTLEFAHRMTMSGSKVEGWCSESDKCKNVVTGKILSLTRHPDSDHLWICSVDIGAAQPIQIVTGAQNLKEGNVVPAALDGSELPNGAHIKKGKLRGEVSDGMLCSIGELGFTVHDYPDCIEDGIMVLPASTPVGEDICKVLGMDDVVVEFEITSNRPDCMCVTGLAREAAITFGTALNMPQPQITKSHGDINAMLSVENKTPDNCLRYTGAVVENVRVKPSPVWMRERLRHSGVRPINNIVDITNYVMLELNQPMHAFDYRNVKDGKIVVRQAAAGEKIETLDGVERTLTDKMMVIADSEKPIAVAGVMGGEYSGIADDTTSIVFESACFNGVNVRATAKGLGMRTEASARYEKGLDPNNTEYALKRALELVIELDAGDVVAGFVDAKGTMPEKRVIPLEPERICAFIGAQMDTDFMIKTLRLLEFTVDDKLNVTPPSFRADIEGFADVAEEVARFYGYDKIPTTVMRGTTAARPTERQRFERALINACVGCGAYEINTYSWLSAKTFDMLNLPTDSPLRRGVVISNPLGEDSSLMRTTVVPSMLDTLVRNINARVPAACMFELAVEFLPDADANKLPVERKKLCVGGYGKLDFYRLKGIITAALRAVNVRELSFEPCEDNPVFHPGRTATLSVCGTPVGVLGEINPIVAANYGVKERMYVADIDAEKLFELQAGVPRYTQIPRFPATTRDLALVCELNTPSAVIESVIREKCGKILESLDVFDVYTGDKIAAGKKSIAYSLILRERERTLTDEEADAAIKRSLKALDAMGIQLRS